MTTEPTYQESKRVAEDSREADWKQSSFGRELFMGNLQLELIHPQPELPARSIEDGERFLEQPEPRTEVLELADLFCGQARRRADALLTSTPGSSSSCRSGSGARSRARPRAGRLRPMRM
jgi:hypothetical protein